MRFYFLNPSPDVFWYDIISQKELIKKWSWNKHMKVLENYSTGNSLLSSWGKIGQELYAQLFQLDETVLDITHFESKPIEGKTLLTHIQREISENIREEDREEFITLDQIQDKSIQITAHYSERREVEVLYNHLLDLLENKYQGDLEAHEIVVMLSDIEKYLPYIQTVFEHATVKLPYSISDKPANDSKSVFSACLEVMNSYNDELTSESIMSLLDYEVLRKRYQIQDVLEIREIVRSSNIKFGIHGDKTLETHLVDWEQGLKKMLYGIFMKEAIFEKDESFIHPYAHAEGAILSDLLNFITFVRDVIKRAQISRKDRSLVQWNQYFVDLIDTFTSDIPLSDEGYEEELFTIRKKLENLDFIDQKLNGVSLSFDVYLYILQTYHVGETQKEGYYRGRITFCKALPMRSIPFKVLAFLGLNSDDFPRKETDFGFDLIKNGKGLTALDGQERLSKRLGDRSVKDNDKYLFLEALLSAREHLYLSYVGRDQKNSKEKARSVILDELLDYIQSGTEVEDVTEVLVKEHPLRNSSNKYKEGNSDYFTYLTNDSQNLFQKLLNNESEDGTEGDDGKVEISQMAQFFKHSVKYYFQRVLGIYYKEEAILLEEQELFDVSPGLAEYKLKEELIHLKDTELEEYIDEKKTEGRLPLRNVASLKVKQVFEDQSTIREAYQELIAGKEKHDANFTLALLGGELVVEVEGLYSNDLIIPIFSKEEKVLNTLLSHLLYWLALRANGMTSNLHLVTNTKTYTFLQEEITEEQASKELERLFKFYNENRDRLIPFHPRFSFLALEKKAFEYKMVQDAKYDEYLADSIDRKLWEDTEAIKEIANKVFGPLHERLKLKGVKV